VTIKRRTVTNVTNPKPLQGSFQTFRKYVGFEATFRSDKPPKSQESWYWPRLRSRFWISLGTTLVSHISMCHVTHINESCQTYEWVMSHIWMSHVTHMNESCHTYQWVMSHISMSHVTHLNESCHTYEWVMLHISMSHVTHINESCHTY